MAVLPTTAGNLLAEVRQAMLLSRVSSRGGELMTARQALRMATAGGADALKRDDIGTIERRASAPTSPFSRWRVLPRREQRTTL